MSHRAALAAFLLLPLLAAAGAVPVCDGTLTQLGPDGSGNYSIVCSEAWRFADEPYPTWISTLAFEDVGLLAGSVLLLWAVAWVLRMIRIAVSDNAP